MVFGGFGGGGGTNRVTVHIVGDKKDLDKKIKSSEKEVKDSGSRMTRSLKANATQIKAGITVAAVAVGAFAKVAISRAEDMASAYAITEKVIEQTGGAANLTAEEIGELSKAQAFNTGINKLAITEGNNILLTFKNIRTEVGEGNDIFERASAAMLDMSTVMGTDAKAGAVQLGKALNDPITGISALARVGVTFSDVQKDQIRNFQESGDLMSAQKIILAELESQMGGTAEAAADDSAKIARSFDEITEAIGVGLLPLLATATRLILEFFGHISTLESLSMLTGFDVGSVELAAGAINQLGKETRSLIGVSWLIGKNFASGVEQILDESELTNKELIKLANNVELLRDVFDLTGDQAETLALIIKKRLIKEAFGESRKPLQNFAWDLGEIEKALRKPRRGVEDLGLEVGNADEAMLLMARRGGPEARRALERIKEAADTAVPGVREMEDAVDAVNSAMLASADPIFQAVRAYSNYTETLERVGEEGNRTAEEQLELSAATLEAQAALAGLSEAEILRGLQAIADSLGISVGEARDLLVELGILDGSEVNLVFELSMDPADRALLEMARRGGSGGEIPIDISPPDIRGIGHTGGRINAPRGQEVFARVLGGEEISNPAHGGNGSGPAIQILPVFVGSEAALGAELDRLLTKRGRSSPLGFV